jgi:peptidoglycan hydrolase-like protein with peptidoglycan-binding domain
MQQPAPVAPGAGPATSNRGNPQVAAPNTATPYGQPANLSSDTVKQARQQLKSEGLYRGAIDGRVGPATRAAVRRFQQQNGLTTNAILDQETLQRLMSDHHD